MPGGYHRVCCCTPGACTGNMPYDIYKDIRGYPISNWDFINEQTTFPFDPLRHTVSLAQSDGLTLISFELATKTTANMEVWKWDGIDVWELINNVGPKLYDTKLLYDAAHGKHVFIGGYTGTDLFDSKIRTFDGTNWADPVGQDLPMCFPTNSINWSGVVYNPTDNLFMAIDVNYWLWTFNRATKIWTKVEQGYKPEGRVSQIIYDPINDRVLIVSVLRYYQSETIPPETPGYRNTITVWAFERSANWTFREIMSINAHTVINTTSTAILPLVYNSDTETCLFIHSFQNTHDVYEVDGNTIAYKKSITGIYTYMYKATYDVARHRVTILCNTTTLRDYDYTNNVITSTYDFDSEQEQQYRNFAIAYDAHLNRTVIYCGEIRGFSGTAGKPWNNTMYVWNGTNMDASHTMNMRASGGLLVYDTQNNQLAFFSQNYDLIDSDSYSYINAPDIWYTTDYVSWNYISVQPNMYKSDVLPVSCYDITYIPADGTTPAKYLYYNYYLENSVWEYNTTTLEWTRYFNTGMPTIEKYSCMAYDPILKKFLFYRGTANELWEYDPVTRIFTRINIACPNIPANPIRMAWHGSSQKMMLFMVSYGILYDDLEFDYCYLDEWKLERPSTPGSSIHFDYLPNFIEYIYRIPNLISFDNTIHAVVRDADISAPVNSAPRYRHAKIANFTCMPKCLRANITGITVCPQLKPEGFYGDFVVDVTILEDNTSSTFDMNFDHVTNDKTTYTWISSKPAYRLHIKENNGGNIYEYNADYYLTFLLKGVQQPIMFDVAVIWEMAISMIFWDKTWLYGANRPPPYSSSINFITDANIFTYCQGMVDPPPPGASGAGTGGTGIIVAPQYD